MSDEPLIRFGGQAQVWIWSTPREGEIVPDYPPMELTGYVADVEVTADDEDGPCGYCERCTWNPGPDCGKAEHPHCPTCGHCEGRHVRPPA